MFPLLTAGVALANGQSTHIWITDHALAQLPEGELRDLLTDPALQPFLLNGTMFPDGGYAVGDDYGELAHWEPLQNAYRDWIAAHYSAPWSDEGAQHVAFWLGMSSHGIADQVFDSLYMERARQEDAESDWSQSMDMATDVVFMSTAGPVDYPEHWIPGEVMVDLLAEQGHSVELGTLEEGQALLRVAIAWVSGTSQDAGLVDEYAAQFPWASSHLDEEDMPGSPPCEGQVLTAYWQSQYRRLSGDLSFDPEILATVPAAGSYEHPTDADRVETRISVVFSQAIAAESLTDDIVQLIGPDGPHPITSWLFYGDSSHVLHIAPTEDLAPDTRYDVRIGEGLTTIDGQQTSGASTFWFSTGLAPDAPPAPQDSAGCAHLTGGPWWLAGLLGLRRRRAAAAAESPPQ